MIKFEEEDIRDVGGGDLRGSGLIVISSEGLVYINNQNIFMYGLYKKSKNIKTKQKQHKSTAISSYMDISCSIFFTKDITIIRCVSESVAILGHFESRTSIDEHR